MFLAQIKKLRALQEQHAHAIALMKQQGEDLGDDRDKLQALALFELNLAITDAVHEYAAAVGDDAPVLAASATLLAGAAGAISGIVGRGDPQFGEKILDIVKEHQQQEYEKYK